MSRADDIAAAALAGIVGGALKSLENKMVAKSSTDSGVQIHPNDFLNINKQQQTTNNTNVVPKGTMIEQPKSRPAGSEIVGTESVDLGSIMIPMDGADKGMREAIKRHSAEALRLPIPPKPMVVGKVNPIQPPNIPNIPNIPNNIMTILKSIDEKLDLLLKRAKIQPRYKKKNKEINEV